MAGAQQKIAEAFKDLARAKDLDKISVDEIITKANVSRQSFYKYFSDKYNLAIWLYHQEISSAPLERYSQNGDYEEINLAILQNLAKDPQLYKNLFKNAGSSSSFRALFHRHCLAEMLNIVGKFSLNPSDLLTIYDCYTTGTDAMIARWLSEGMKEDAEWLAQIFLRAMPEELKPIFMLNKRSIYPPQLK